MHEKLSHHNISDLLMTVCRHALNAEMRLCKLRVAGRGLCGISMSLACFLGMNVYLTCPKSDELSVPEEPVSSMQTLCRC